MDTSSITDVISCQEATVRIADARNSASLADRVGVDSVPLLSFVDTFPINQTQCLATCIEPLGEKRWRNNVPRTWQTDISARWWDAVIVGSRICV